MNKLILTLPFFVCSFSLLGALRNFETTRLKSTAGAGVGSILLEEATVLNPAPLAFYKHASIYFQKASGDLTKASDSGINPIYPESSTSGSQAIIISDSKARLKGSLSYQKVEERFDIRKKYSAALSSTISKSSALGVSFSRVEDRSSSNGFDYEENKYWSQTYGVIHAVSKSISLGIIAIDPFGDNENSKLAKVGAQYVYKNFISLMADFGAKYENNASDSLIYNLASQFMIYDDFFLRFGHFSDKGARERGNGVGLSWIQPKLALDAAIKNIKRDDFPEIAQSGDTIRETSFSISYRW